MATHELSDKPSGWTGSGGPLVVLCPDNPSMAQNRVEEAGGKIVRPILAFVGGCRFPFEGPDGYELAMSSTDGAAQ